MKSMRAIQKDLNKLKEKIESGLFDDKYEADVETGLVAPFFKVFGWDTEDPSIVSRQYFTEEHKRVDYVLKNDSDQINVAIEVKRITEGLDPHIKQLKGYFDTTTADLGILTNGQQYWFFSWDAKGKAMHPKPFAIIDICDIKLKKEDAFLEYIKRDTFNPNLFLFFSRADSISGRLHSVLGADMNNLRKPMRLARKSFFYVFSKYDIKDSSVQDFEHLTEEGHSGKMKPSSRKLTRKEISTLWEYTKHHSRWRYDHSRVRVAPMKKVGRTCQN